MKMKVLLVRGAFLNNYELQSFVPLLKEFDIRAIGSLYPIHSIVGISMSKLFSPYDLATISRRIPLLPKLVLGTLNRTSGDPHFLYGLETFVKENGPFDIAHGAETYYGYDLQLARLKEQGWIKKLVLTCWDTIPHNNESLQQKRDIKSQVKKVTDAYIAVTNRARDALVTEGVSNDLIHTIYPGIDQTRFNATERVTPHDPFRILVVGRMSWEKGVDDLGSILMQLHESGVRFTCTWIGKGPLRSRLEYYAGLLPNNTLQFKESAYEAMNAEYQRHDVLLHLARSDRRTAEQFGMVVAEALSCGLPVISYDTGALAEVIGDTGVIIKEGDCDAVIAHLQHLMTDSTTYRHLSRSGISRARKMFSMNKQARKIRDLYTSLR